MIKRDVKAIEVVIYQRDIKEWHAIAFDVSEKNHRHWLGETICESRSEAEQYAIDIEDFYLCDLEVTDGRI